MHTRTQAPSHTSMLTLQSLIYTQNGQQTETWSRGRTENVAIVLGKEMHQLNSTNMLTNVMNVLVVLTKFVFVEFVTRQHTRENAVYGLDVEKLCCGVSVDHNHVNNSVYPKVLASCCGSVSFLIEQLHTISITVLVLQGSEPLGPTWPYQSLITWLW